MGKILCKSIVKISNKIIDVKNINFKNKNIKKHVFYVFNKKNIKNMKKRNGLFI